jgi:type I restriction enzyme S subunit
LRTQEVRFLDIYDTEVKITSEGLSNSLAKWIPKNCVIIAISGATAARSGINKIPLTTNQHCCNLEIDEKQASYRYVFHWVSREYERMKALGQGARADLNASIIKSYHIPLPPLAEQERIVAILDRFDALTNDLTSGLPAEIEARRKQYEYYRDKLLNFKEKSA